MSDDAEKAKQATLPPTEDPAEHKARMQALQKEQRDKVKAKTIQRGVIIVNTGDGKGKSTAAFGLALRAVGNNQRVGLVQFVKGKWKTGEAEALKRFPEIDHVVSGAGFTWDTQDRELDIAAARAGWQTALSMMHQTDNGAPKYHLLILDELNIALRYDQLPLDEVLDALRSKPQDLNIVITGRDAPDELIALADTVTNMMPVKHAFDAGIPAQRGIEF